MDTMFFSLIPYLCIVKLMKLQDMKTFTKVMKRLWMMPFVCFCVQGMAQSLVPEGTRILPSDSHIQYVGRFSFRNPDAPVFTYPGAQINARFEGTSLRMMAKPMSGYFMVQVDGSRPFKVSFNAPKDSIVTLATALRNETHEVRVMYAIEGYQRLPEFRGFWLDEGCRLLDPPYLPERKIEFIGDSMTCGFGVESTDASEPYSDETENHYYTYAALAARALKAQHVVVARSGIGIYRNYAAPKTGSSDCMPRCYDQTLFGVDSLKWDFANYVPDVVCVNLGTNDVSTDPYDKTMMENAYRDFYYTLRARYPNTKIVFLSGCMLVGRRLEHVQFAMDAVVRQARINGDGNVFRFDMSSQTGDLGMGASGHPSMWQQEKMASELTAYLRGLMGWF